MIELNLLPEELKYKKRTIELPKLPLGPIAVSFIVFLIALQLLLVGLIFISKSRLRTLGKTWHALMPKKAELDRVKHSILATNTKIRAIDSLIEKRFGWSRLLNEISESLTSNVWLTELSYAEKKEPSAGGGKTRTLKLSGSASAKGEEATRDIARFIKALKANDNFFKYFEDVELVSIKEGMHANQAVMNFTLVSAFKDRRER